MVTSTVAEVHLATTVTNIIVITSIVQTLQTFTCQSFRSWSFLLGTSRGCSPICWGGGEVVRGLIRHLAIDGEKIRLMNTLVKPILIFDWQLSINVKLKIQYIPPIFEFGAGNNAMIIINRDIGVKFYNTLMVCADREMFFSIVFVSPSDENSAWWRSEK